MQFDEHAEHNPELK